MNSYIVACKYFTDSDVGLFESDAWVNLHTGEVFNIKKSDDEIQEQIEQVYREYITFVLNEIEFECIIYDVEDFLIKVPEDVKKIMLMNDMQRDLSEQKDSGMRKPKI